MTLDPILLIGGAGTVGRQAARFLRETYPELPLLIGGRDLARAQQAAAGIGNAEGVAVDLDAQDIGLGARPVSAIAIFSPTPPLPRFNSRNVGACPISACPPP